MSLIVPHNVSVVRHAALPYLWRVLCSCGFKAFAPDYPKALVCKAQHLTDEEPFPDLGFLDEGTKQ